MVLFPEIGSHSAKADTVLVQLPQVVFLAFNFVLMNRQTCTSTYVTCTSTYVSMNTVLSATLDLQPRKPFFGAALLSRKSKMDNLFWPPRNNLLSLVLSVHVLLCLSGTDLS